MSSFWPQGRQVLLETYVGLAVGVPGAAVEKGPGWTLCTGPAQVRFANFAACFDLKSEEDFETMLSKAMSHRDSCGQCPVSFMVAGGDRPDDLGLRLTRRGFSGVYALSHLVWPPDSALACRGQDAPLHEALSLRLRLKAARFMTRQFFPGRRREAQESMEQATARSPHRLFTTADRLGRLTGGIMVTAAPGALGLYNVCIRRDLRGRGLGAGLVRQAQGMAAQLGLPLYLQCAGDLAPWYRSLGFLNIGLVASYFQEPSQIV